MSTCQPHKLLAAAQQNNSTVAAGSGTVLAMSSQDVASLTGKEHKNVCVDIRKMLSDLGEDALKFQRIYRDSMNRPQTEYLLDRELTDTLLTGYSAVLRRKVIARWRELEQEAAAPVLPNFADPAAAARAWADEVEAKQLIASKAAQLEHQVAEQAPAVAAFDRIANADGTMCMRDAAKALQIQPNKLTSWLITNKWIYHRVGKAGYLAYQEKIQTGYLTHKSGTYKNPETGEDKISEQVRITGKGLTALASRMGAPPAQ